MKGVSPIASKNQKVYKVGAVNKAIKNVLDSNPYLQDIVVVGEVSNYRPNNSGHWYFSLKDEEAVIDVVMYKWQHQHLQFTPENGMSVFIKGNVTFYEKGGRTQLLAKNMAVDGVGNLHQKFEELKKNLEKEGLFDARHKKPIPKFPKVIGVVTSQTGAAVRDVITTIKRRYPIAKIELYPVIVQGEKAAPSVSKAIEFFNHRNTADVLIVGRGGGSIEDLWAFNEEIVARAIFNSSIPIISAVGHETDTTIADFVADVRAATPTGAAEIATPYPLRELELEKSKMIAKITSNLQRKVKHTQDLKKQLDKNVLFRHPLKKLGDMAQRKDRAMEDLVSLTNFKLDKGQHMLSQLVVRLNAQNPIQRIKELSNQIGHTNSVLQLNMQSKIKDARNELNQTLIQLDGLSPLKIMSKGYSLTYKNDQLVKGVADLNVQDEIIVKMKDGQCTATINQIEGGN